MNSVTMIALQQFPVQLEQLFYAIPEAYWLWSPESWDGIPSEHLNALEQICHIRDVEIAGYHLRFQRMLTESTPVLHSLDGYALVQQKNYAQSTPAAVFKEFCEARTVTMQLLSQLSASQLARTGYFEGYGRVTVAGLIHYLCSHDQQHLAGLQWLLGQIASGPAAK